MYSDFHIHTGWSSDSETPPEAQIERALALGMTEICFTDHQDFGFPPGDLDFLFDTGKYLPAMTDLRQRYAGRIRVNIGVELGLQPHLGEQLAEYAGRYPFDFIIGSTHIARRMDPYDRIFFEGISEEEAYRSYFEEELENLTKYDCYDVAGHIDYVVRYGPNQNRNYSYRRYVDVLDAILRTVIDRGKGIECNTNGIRVGLGEPNPSWDILRRYRELGGEILTLGADAHEPAHLGYAFDTIGDRLKECGFRYYTVFHGREPEFRPL